MGDGTLSLVDAEDIEYLEGLLSHLLHGHFAPRSDKNIELSRHDVSLTVKRRNVDGIFELIVPDVTGNFKKEPSQIQTCPKSGWIASNRPKGHFYFSG